MASRDRVRDRLRDGADVLRALPVVLGVRVLLSVLPYAWWRPLIARALDDTAPRGSAVDDARAIRVARAVSRAARLVPAASCLTQALAAHVILAPSGRPARLRLGVARDRDGGLRAHAWLETCEGTLDVGVVDGAFAPLAATAGSRPTVRRRRTRARPEDREPQEEPIG